jgi:diacylglycerol kinase (ATP)
MVAGGDGTVGWILDTIDKLRLDPKPEVGILPLGTGNDLSRVLGWGEVFSCSTPVNEIMDKILKATAVDIDRWKVSITPVRLFPGRGKRQVLMNNYFSVGVDALVALNFHETRSSKIYQWLGNRFVNKFLYLTFGTKDFFEGRKCSCLNERILLEMDGQPVQLPQLESIVVLNIPSWGGGAHLWSMNLDGDRCDGEGRNWPIERINDKKLEVVGLYSTFHIGQLMIGLSEPLRLGQASQVRIRLMERLPIQVDGEPWLQYPSVVDITFHGKSPMLTTKGVF